MSNEKMRIEFEEWASSEGLNLRKCNSAEIVYLMAETNFVWRAWKASRELLVIKLPDRLDYIGCSTAIEVCKKAIEAAGLKVTP